MKKLLLILLLLPIFAVSQHHAMMTLAGQTEASVPTYEDNGGIAYNSGTTVDVPYPTTNSNDILVLSAFVSTTSTVGTTPSGWTLLYVDNATNVAGVFYWKRADGTETGSETVTLGTSGNCFGLMIRFSGCTTSGSPFDATSTQSWVNSSTHTFGAITGVGSLLFAFIIVDDNYSYSPFSEYTTTAFDLSTTSGTDAYFQGYSESGNTIGTSVGTQSFTDYHFGINFLLE